MRVQWVRVVASRGSLRLVCSSGDMCLAVAMPAKPRYHSAFPLPRGGGVIYTGRKGSWGTNGGSLGGLRELVPRSVKGAANPALPSRRVAAGVSPDLAAAACRVVASTTGLVTESPPRN